MEAELWSLTIICAIAFAAPYVASLIPGRPIPETVFLVFAGALLGPNGLGVIRTSYEGIQLMSELGLAFLFLMAGYEIDVGDLKGPMGRHSCVTWALSFALAVLVTKLLHLEGTTKLGGIAFAIAMTTTAFGTLAPILRDRGLLGTPVGRAVSIYGATGELLPVLAMALLLDPAGPANSALMLGLFVAVCLLVYRRTTRAKSKGGGVVRFLEANVETGSQAPIRATVVLLVFLVTVSVQYRLDAVLGAFAAGFILRSLVPDRNKTLDSKLDAMAFGLLVPVFFVVSGASIDLAAVGANPVLLIAFMGLLLVVRAVPVAISLKAFPETRDLTAPERIDVALYCSMALPIIVAVTKVAVENDAMDSSMASVLVTAGALTVLVVPVLTTLTRSLHAAHPVLAVEEIAQEPSHIGDVLHEHHLRQELAAEEFRLAREAARAEGRRLSSADYLATRRSHDHGLGRHDGSHGTVTDKKPPSRDKDET